MSLLWFVLQLPETHWIFYIGHNYSMNEEGELERRMIKVG